MTRTELIVDQMRHSFDGEAWHGPAVKETLDGVTAEQAAAKPVAHAHSIWELVLHMTTWSNVVARRLTGQAYQPSDEENFPSVSDKSDKAWKAAVKALLQAHESLLSAVEKLPEMRLTEIVPGKPYPFEFMLHGLVQHDLYHAGQIALLKKAQ